MQFVRTKYGVFTVADTFFGQHPIQIDDPEADHSITMEELRTFKLGQFPRIPAEVWSAWVKLCFHFCEQGVRTEVSCRLMHDETGAWRILVPRQEVGGASVRVKTFDESVDLITGEEHTFYPPEGWRPLGSSHSHNTMGAFFSGTDDQYEISDPGAHIVVGGISTKTRQYEIASSICANKTRFKLPHYDVLLDATPIQDSTFHPKVLEYVQERKWQPLGGAINSGVLARTQLMNQQLRDTDDDTAYQLWQREVYGAGTYSRSRSSCFSVGMWQLFDTLDDALNALNDVAIEELSVHEIKRLRDFQDDVSQFFDLLDSFGLERADDVPDSSSATPLLLPSADSAWDDDLSTQAILL